MAAADGFFNLISETREIREEKSATHVTKVTSEPRPAWTPIPSDRPRAFRSESKPDGIVRRTRWAGEVKYVINSPAVEWLIDVDLAKFKSAFVAEMLEVGLAAG